MNLLYLLPGLINDIFIRSLFISVLSIILAGKILKSDTRNAFAIVKWLILIYAGLNIICYLIACIAPDAVVSFTRATKSYDFTDYLMLVPNTLLPLLLLFRTLGHNKYVLLTLSFLMNVGWIFELFIIYRTNMHREFTTGLHPFNFLWFMLLYGVLIGSIIYAIGRTAQRKIKA